MAVGISVTGSAVLGFEITVTDATEGDRLRVTRVDNDGYYETVAVRGADLINPSSATSVFTDYEAPFNTDLTYIAETFALSDLDTPLNSDSQTGVDTAVPLGFAMIMEVVTPVNRVAGAVEEFKGWAREGSILSKTRIIGRSNPVILSDVMGGREGNLKMSNLMGSTFDYDDSTPTEQGRTRQGKWREVFESGAALLFRSDVQATGIEDFFFKCTGFAMERQGRAGGNLPDFPILTYDIKWAEIDRPLTTLSGLGLTTWGDLLEANADWAEVMADHSDWASVLSDPTL